ncbi:response regulator transcription factor [Amycolatopsis oliviviridis]|uniref:DNA-binding response regulator n=2 Tax=Amycolatopsis oliviviridis TaxID=1471590 RepID=A0ABQ3L5D7_9PSEU|nr:DNA-binding response regulator [Amycolatopsis oliviviridis]
MRIVERCIDLVLMGGNDLFHNGLRALLDRDPSFRLVADVEDAVQVDVIIVDLDSIDVDESFRIIDRWHSCGIVLIGGEREQGRVRELLTRGASAYLRRTVLFDQLAATIKSVSVGSDDIVITISREDLPLFASAASVRLSARETDVLELVCQALKNDEIARQLFISQGTVKRHLANIYTKLGAVSRIDALNKAVAAGLLSARQAGPDSVRAT